MEGNTHKYVAEEGSRDLFCRRAPHGARGLKHLQVLQDEDNRRRAPHGARGLKLLLRGEVFAVLSRAPHGARGLKLVLLGDCPRPVTSRPAWGAWIETPMMVHESIAP